jgi:glyceraldehyde-3-phosphate dehydrogenase (NADP+)
MMSVPIFSIDPSDCHYKDKPFVNGAKILIDGKVLPWNGETSGVHSPIIDSSHGERAVIGRIAHMTPKEAIEAVDAAKKAWRNGQGAWPQASVEDRIGYIENLIKALKEQREEIIKVLVWEICKSEADAAKEFDRTVSF